MTDINLRLRSIGVDLPRPNPAAGHYRPYLSAAGLLSISGQTCKRNGELVFRGKVGRELDRQQAKEAARLCALNLIGQLNGVCKGNWSRLVQCLKLTVFINCTEDFEELPWVANGASDLLVEVFGERGQHSRSAIGVTSLPGGSAIEIDALCQVTEQ